MFYGSDRSKILHTCDCSYVRRSRSCGCGRMREFHTVDEARRDGYRMCKKCDPVVRRFKPEEHEIARFCNNKNIFYRLSNGELEIITRESHWKACIGNGSRIQLYHQNRRGSKYERRDYHLQKYEVGSALPMLDYIVRHDEFTSAPRVDQKRKSPKGSRKYANMVKREKDRKKRRDIKYVLDLIDALAAS